MATISIGDADIYYEEHGAGETVLLVAGLGGAGTYWQPNMAAFAEKYRTISHDHRGTGRSTASLIQYSVKQMTDDLVRLMDKLHIDRAHLVGHSTGGAMGQIMAIEHPDRLKSMVLYASWTSADPFMRRIMAIRRSIAEMCGALAYMQASPVFLYPDWWVNENGPLLKKREAAGVSNMPPVEIITSRIDAIMDFDRFDDLHRIQTPTQVLCAQDDFLTPLYFSEALARAIPNAQLDVLPSGGHACSEVTPDAFNEKVFRFIDAHSD